MRGVELCLIFFLPFLCHSLPVTIVPTLGINGGVGELNMVELRHIILMNVF